MRNVARQRVDPFYSDLVKIGFLSYDPCGSVSTMCGG
jgi:hypothetical protein